MKAGVVFLLGWLALASANFGCEAKDRTYLCEVDGNCMAQEACIDGECKSVDCRIDADCDADQRCQDYECIADVACQSDHDCGSSEACFSGQCQQVECKDDSQCPSSESCLNYECIVAVDCSTDQECLEGQVCEAGFCVTGCRDDADCPDGQTCLADQGDHGLCAECQTEQDCPPGLKCIEFLCVEHCANDGECPDGQICVQNSCREGCRDDLDCPEGVCHPQSQTCVECVQPSDCPDERPLCEDSLCVPECYEDIDCPGEQICVMGNCLAETRECALVITPGGPYEFGQIRVGAQKRFSVVLENQGHASCFISELDLKAGTFTQSDFSISDPPALPLTLRPAGQADSSIRLEIVFTPLEIGQHLAALWLVSNDPDLQIGANQDLCYALQPPAPGQACIPMQGTGVLIDVTAIPSELDFGGVSVQCGSSEETIRLTNLGSALNVSDVFLLDPNNTEFRIVSHPQLPFQLGNGQTFSVVVQFLPEYPGPRSNSLMVEFFESSVTDLQIPLYGEGTDTQSTSDLFELPDDVSVDVLFVVDNSGTMEEEQAALAENFHQLISWAISLEVDFHVGVTSTDMDDPSHQGRLQGDVKIITPATPNPEEVFAANVQLGIYGSGDEQGLAASHAALSLPLLETDNQGFLREQAKLQVIYVSDEDDFSPAEPEFYVSYFLELKDNIAWVGLSAICGDLPAGCPNPENPTAEPGPRYHAVVNSTRGMFQSICEPDWSVMLSQLGEHIFAPIRMFSLSQHPDPATIQVAVDGLFVPQASCEGCPDGWTYLPNLNNILFGRDVLPPYGSDVEIYYQAVCF